MTDYPAPSWDAAIAAYLREVAETPATAAVEPATGAIGPMSAPPVPREDDPSPWPEVEPVIDPLDDVREQLGTRHAHPALTRATRQLRSLFVADDVPDTVMQAAATIQSPITTGRRIVVMGAVGGCGTSTVAAMIGLQMAAWRRDRMALVAAHPDGGRLHGLLPSVRATLPAPLLAEGDSLGADASVGNLLVVDHPGPYDPPVPGDALVQWLCRTRAVCVVETGTAPSPALLEQAHVILLVTAPSVPGVEAARAALAEMPPGEKAVVAVVDTGRPSGLPVERAAAILGPSAIPVPSDRHLAGGVAIDPLRTAEATREAVARVAAAVMAVANPHVEARAEAPR